MSTSTARHFIHRVIYTGFLSIPVVIYVNDCWFTLATVRGVSMEPSLLSGDIVWVRRADFFPFFSMYRSSRIRVRDLTDEDTLIQNKSIKALQEVSDLQHSLQVERSIGKTPIHELTWRRSPPIILPGDVVVYQDSSTFQPATVHIKRAVGVGGQKVRYNHGVSKVENVSPSYIWVEGDNANITVDYDGSAVSKKLIVGKADFIIWPPSRIGKIERQRPSAYKSWWV